MIRMEQDFMMVNLSSLHRGVLKTIGEREIVVDIKLFDDSDEADNTWLMEQTLELYKAYYARYMERKNGGGV